MIQADKHSYFDKGYEIFAGFVFQPITAIEILYVTSFL